MKYTSYLKICILFILLLFVSDDLAEAHSNLEKTEPSNNQILEQSPSEVEIWFQDQIVAQENSFILRTLNNEEINVLDIRIDEKDSRHYSLKLGDSLPSGQYVIDINVFSLDGHKLSESFSFTVKKSEKKTSTKSQKLKILKHSPTDGEITKTAPEKIDMWFNQPVEITAIGLFNDQKESLIIDEPIIDSENPSHISFEIDYTLDDGTYQVTWYGKPKGVTDYQSETMDVFYFAVKEYTPIQKDLMGQMKEIKTQSWFERFGLSQVSYFLIFLGTMILFGGSFLLFKVRESYKRWRVSTWIFGGLAIIGDLILIISQRTEINNIYTLDFLSIKFIWIPTLHLLFIIIGLILRKYNFIAYGIALLLITYIVGHAVNPSYGGVLSILLNSIHLIAASIWVGGIFTLLIPPINEFENWIKKAGTIFSKWAIISLPIIIITGIWLTIAYVPSFNLSSLWMSDWGKSIIGKTVLVLVVLVIGFFQRSTLKAGLAVGIKLFRKRLRFEFVYAVLITIFASLLVVSIPSTAERGIYLLKEEEGSVPINIKMTPIQEGLNELILNFDSDNIDKVEISIEMPPDYEVSYNAFKTDKDTFKISGNLIHTPGISIMTIKAYSKDDKVMSYQYQISVPGEKTMD